MVTSTEQIQIFYEISMSIGTSLDLHKMVKTALITYLKKLNCAAGAILQLRKEKDGYFEYQKVYSIPRNIETITYYKEAFSAYSLSGNNEKHKECIAVLPYNYSHSDGQSSLIMNLPDFGILFLSTGRKKFDEYIIRSIIQLNSKFGQACEACIQNKIMRTSEEKYRSIFEESQDIIFVSSKEGVFLDINPAGLRLFGYSSLDEIKKIDIAKDLYKDPEETHKCQARLQENGFIKDYELKLKKKDGSELIVIEDSTANYDAEKNLIGRRGILCDITEKKKLENQLAQMQKMESIGTLAGGIAHDFNNLLTVINGYAEMALMRTDDGSPLHSNVMSILKAGKAAENLTRQILAFSRKQIIQPKIIDINQTVSDLNKMIRRLIGEDIDIEMKLAPALPGIKADPSQVEQILINLIVNARDAINQKIENAVDKKITIETDQVDLNKRFVTEHLGSQTGAHVCFSVSDNGLGMSDDVKQKIFEPFFTTKEKGKGTGLGMSSVYGIVKQNNGSIYVYSELNRGTSIKIYWPISKEAMAESIVEEISNKELCGNEIIVFAEDEDQVRKFGTSALKNFGYQVFEASNGKEAVELVKNNNISADLLITDLVMPEMNGKEASEKIKKLIPDIKILFTSGYTDTHIVHSGELEKDINFLHKPYSIFALLKKLREIIDNG